MKTITLKVLQQTPLISPAKTNQLYYVLNFLSRIVIYLRYLLVTVQKQNL